MKNVHDSDFVLASKQDVLLTSIKRNGCHDYLGFKYAMVFALDVNDKRQGGCTAVENFPYFRLCCIFATTMRQECHLATFDRDCASAVVFIPATDRQR